MTRDPRLKVIGNILITVFGAVIVLLLLAFVAGESQRELANRVDQRVGEIEVQLARHRYVTDCLFYTGPFIGPGEDQAPAARDVAALKLCLSESLVIGPEDVADIGVILERNLRQRGVE
jgi:hypothetical protein